MGQTSNVIRKIGEEASGKASTWKTEKKRTVLRLIAG
jgi:hypothetical protein